MMNIASYSDDFLSLYVFHSLHHSFCDNNNNNNSNNNNVINKLSVFKLKCQVYLAVEH